ncbi:MAG: hypothetical protein NVS3B1_22110 [Marmoricola sp.]
MTPTSLDPLFPILGGTDNPSGSTAMSNPGGGVSLTPAGRPNSQSTAFYGAAGGSDTNLGGLAAVPVSGAGFEPADPGAFGQDPSGGVSRAADGSVRVSGQDEQAGTMETSPGISPTAFPEPTP